MRYAAILTLLLVPAACKDQGDDPRHVFASDVEECRDHMRRIYEGLREYDERFGHAPEAAGTGFLAALILEGIWENSAENALRLTCPGPGVGQRVPADLPPERWFAEAGAVVEAASAYAVRDFAAFPLESFPNNGSEPILCCDNHLGMNHEGVLNVLFADGSVVLVELDREIEQGRLPVDSQVVPVGPDSPIPALAQMRAPAR